VTSFWVSSKRPHEVGGTRGGAAGGVLFLSRLKRSWRFLFMFSGNSYSAGSNADSMLFLLRGASELSPIARERLAEDRRDLRYQIEIPGGRVLRGSICRVRDFVMHRLSASEARAEKRVINYFRGFLGNNSFCFSLRPAKHRRLCVDRITAWISMPTRSPVLDRV